MASSLTSSPMESDLPSSPASSDASDASSSSSSDAFPIKEMQVSSVAEVKSIVKYAEPEVQLKFRLALDTSLAEAHKLWGFVFAGEGGHGELANPDLLSNKEEALHFVRTKLERLQRWKRHVDRKHTKVLRAMSTLEEVVEGGGPGVLPGYQPHRYNGPAATIDVEQFVDKEDLEDHIADIRDLLLQRSPGSPATEGGDGSVAHCLEREAKEQLDITRLNLTYLEVKAKGLQLLSNHIVDGIGKVENCFVNAPTHLGAGDADFIRFVELPMYAREAPKEA